MNNENSFIVEGYEVEVNETEDSSIYNVILAENGAQVFEMDVPINLEDDNLLIEDVINYAAKAAIDIFEAERDTLGEGAGALEIEANMKSKSQAMYCYFLTSCDYEEWFGQMKGTPYEDQAYQLLSQLIELEIPQSTSNELEELYNKKKILQHELDVLNLERIKTSNDFKKVIIVEAVNENKYTNRVGYSNLDWIEYFVEKFKDHRLEPQVILKIKELVDIHQAISIAESSENDIWDQREEIRNKMDLLSAEKAKNEIEERLPESGITIAPNMAVDLAELMEGVSFEEPLEPIVAINKEDEDGFEKEDKFTELGEIHQGIDIAEVPEEERISFGPGNRIKLKRNIEVPMWGGITKEVKKDTVGWIDSVYDGHGERFFVRLEDGSLFSVSRNDLTK